MSKKALYTNNSLKKPKNHHRKGGLILAVETSGRAGSAAIAVGREILAKKSFSAAMRHNCEIIPIINSLLQKYSSKPSEIEHIYISIGPGSFTGLRIAVTMAKIMYLANQVKIVTVDTLDAIASNVIDLMGEQNQKPQNQTAIERVAVILDAKRSQFFTAVFEKSNKKWQKTIADCLMTAQQFIKTFSDSKRPIWLLGEGLVYYKDKFQTKGIKFFDQRYWYPKAQKIAQLGYKKALNKEFAHPLTLQPNYLRVPEAEENWFKKHCSSPT
ncbi:MAG: tRNA (adenosine(37)-N6)-threonylcarbamoyltransferase complex dimerization subunit type 1 TsaB [Planctomycetota bacterium]|jgi:tRNA threonylcarbamoyladenosine biosynthesis protein TsaB